MNLLQMSGNEKPRGNFVVQTGTWSGFTFELLRPASEPKRQSLPTKVFQGEMVLWSFQMDHPGYHGVGKLLEFEDELFLVLVSGKDLNIIIPVKDLPHRRSTPDGNIVGGRNIKELIRTKVAIATLLELEPVWTRQESAMRTAVAKSANKKREAELTAEKKAKEAERQARLRAREEQRTAIEGRKRQYVFTETGERRNGLPVTGDEWMVMPGGTFCVSVTSFDAETGAVGEPIESFVVDKKSGRPERGAIKTVTRTNPLEKQRAVLEAVVTKIVTIKGEPEEVILAPNMEAIKALRDNGLNSGTLVMCPEKDNDKRFTVFRLENGNIETVATVKSLSAQ